MKAQHTPGPWHMEPCMWGGYPFRISGPGDSAGTAGMFSPALVMGDGTHNRGTAEANARLIAASPSLLSQLEILVDRFGHNDSLEDMAALDAARAVIKQARE